MTEKNKFDISSKDRSTLIIRAMQDVFGITLPTELKLGMQKEYDGDELDHWHRKESPTTFIFH